MAPPIAPLVAASQSRDRMYDVIVVTSYRTRHARKWISYIGLFQGGGARSSNAKNQSLFKGSRVLYQMKGLDE